MKRIFSAIIATTTLAVGCATPPVIEGPLQLGDSERTMKAKMVTQGARDVTKQTRYQFYHQIALVQRYYWLEFPDKTIVAVLVAAPPKNERTVQVIEAGEPGMGIEGIKTWRSQNLKRQSSLPNKRDFLLDSE